MSAGRPCAIRKPEVVIIPRSFQLMRRTVLVVGGMLLLFAMPSPSTGARSTTLPAPTLNPFDGKWHTDSFVVSGSVDTVRFLSFARIYRDGVLVDSAQTTTSRHFKIRVALSPGDNVFTSVLVDSAAINMSPVSNAVVVHFDDSAGLFIPVPFTPGAAFDVNTPEPASRIELRVFDVTGDFVVSFQSNESRTTYTFPWNGQNSSSVDVLRGPLIAIATIEYPDGTRDVKKRAFLYTPKGSP
ncbi:MAG TPA: hypothetical protein VFH88_07565 [Candidatus Krumholzibacteria bacterium]|nr:hypothetical protein [Candidatus Krumholzibacteria bacterium]